MRGTESAASPGSPATSSVDGEVIGVDRTAPQDRLNSSVRVVLRTEAEQPVTVELAPGWYLDEQRLSFSRNDRLRVQGKRSVAPDGSSTIVAWEVEKGRQVVPLRDQQGRPVWAPGSER